MGDTLFRGNREPTLAEILAEPAVRILMRRDGVDERSIRRLMHHAAAASAPRQAPRLSFVAPAPPGTHADPPQASIGVLARAVVEPRWPRVFPSL